MWLASVVAFGVNILVMVYPTTALWRISKADGRVRGDFPSSRVVPQLLLATAFYAFVAVGLAFGLGLIAVVPTMMLETEEHASTLGFVYLGGIIFYLLIVLCIQGLLYFHVTGQILFHGAKSARACRNALSKGLRTWPIDLPLTVLVLLLLLIGPVLIPIHPLIARIIDRRFRTLYGDDYIDLSEQPGADPHASLGAPPARMWRNSGEISCPASSYRVVSAQYPSTTSTPGAIVSEFEAQPPSFGGPGEAAFSRLSSDWVQYSILGLLMMAVSLVANAMGGLTLYVGTIFLTPFAAAFNFALAMEAIRTGNPLPLDTAWQVTLQGYWKYFRAFWLLALGFMALLLPFIVIAALLGQGSETTFMIIALAALVILLPAGLVMGIIMAIHLPGNALYGEMDAVESLTMSVQRLPSTLATDGIAILWAILGSILGLLACCVGIIPATAFIQLVYAEAWRETYER